MTYKDKKNNKKKGVAAVENQHNEKYQSSIIEDKLDNNKGIHTFNNQSK